MPGHLQRYQMTFTWEPLYPVPDACTVDRRSEVDNIAPLLSNYTWYEGEGHSNYTVSIQARTGGGLSPKTQLAFCSLVKGG